MKTHLSLVGFLFSLISIFFVSAQAAPKIKIFTPQSLTDTVNQVKVEFTEPMVSLAKPDQDSDIFSVSLRAGHVGNPTLAK